MYLYVYEIGPAFVGQSYPSGTQRQSLSKLSTSARKRPAKIVAHKRCVPSLTMICETTPIHIKQSLLWYSYYSPTPSHILSTLTKKTLAGLQNTPLCLTTPHIEKTLSYK